MTDDIQTKAFEHEIAKGALSPLADPIVEEIYKDVSVAGLAAESFISAVLAECGETFGTVVELTPQKRETQPGRRGFRIDVFARSDTGGIAMQEVQLYFDPSILQRNLMEASYSYIDAADTGTTTIEMAALMPNVSAINIFGHMKNCRTENKELLQPIHCVYDKEPRSIALKQFAIFNVQIPYFPKAPEDYSNPLYCWCKLLYEMHFDKKLPQEVFEMEPKMREFVESNLGAAQFIARYGEASASPKIKKAYWDWLMASFRESSIMLGARMEGHEEGREEGLEEGLEKGLEQGFEKAAKAMSMLRNGESVEVIMEETGLTRERINSLR